MLLKGGSEQHKGPQSLFVEGLLEGGGGSEQQTGPQSLFVEIGRNKEKALQIGCSKKEGGGRTTQGATVFVCRIR